jgi:hypothetical protein
MLESESNIRDDDRRPFGTHWCGPNRFEIWRETLVAQYGQTSEDGQPVDVYCTAAPARFYTLKILRAPGNVGDPQSPYSLKFLANTGSEQQELVALIAEAIADGMLDFVAPPAKTGSWLSRLGLALRNVGRKVRGLARNR